MIIAWFPEWDSVLFYGGLFISLLGFLVTQAEHIPFTMRVFSPSYFRAKKGFEELRREQLLEPEDRGFDELASLYRNHLQELNPGENIEEAPIQILRIEKSGAIEFHTGRGEVIPIH